MARQALVLGLGVSGKAAVKLLLGEGAHVTGVDRGDDAALAASVGALQTAGADIRLGCVALPDMDAGSDFDLCVVSPGVPVHSDWVRAARSRGMEIVSELELGVQRCGRPVLAVTGTNGKSTMVQLCADALALAGQRAAAVGNCGTPVCDLVDAAPAPDWLVLEVSSFQLETARTLRPRVAVLLNVQPDHLDRHGDMETYRRTKWRLFERMTDDDVAVLPGDWDVGATAGLAPDCRIVTFGLEAAADCRYEAGFVRGSHVEIGAVSVQGTPFHNDVLGRTAAAAVAAVHACGCAPACVGEAARAFQTLPHRMTEVCRARGVRFVDDSKGTNLAALCAALAMTEGPVRLIAGGLLKEKRLEMPKELLANKASGVYLIGAAAEAMRSAWSDVVACRDCGTLARAVAAAWADADKGETVLLSPGCASFDQFTDYGQRGNAFVALATNVQGGERT